MVSIIIMTNGWSSSRDRNKDIDKVEGPIVTYYAIYRS